MTAWGQSKEKHYRYSETRLFTDFRDRRARMIKTAGNSGVLVDFREGTSRSIIRSNPFFWEPINIYFVTNMESLIRETVASRLCYENFVSRWKQRATRGNNSFMKKNLTKIGIQNGQGNQTRQRRPIIISIYGPGTWWRKLARVFKRVLIVSTLRDLIFSPDSFQRLLWITYIVYFLQRSWRRKTTYRFFYRTFLEKKVISACHSAA